ncbi:MAG: exodeoxyribonuclease VII small subunit [Planctomycetota bacterium]
MAGEENGLTYRAAATEIEEILEKIDDEADVDIDELADMVERASKLISFCFDRLKGAEQRVTKVTAELAKTAEGEAEE